MPILSLYLGGVTSLAPHVPTEQVMLCLSPQLALSLLGMLLLVAALRAAVLLLVSKDQK